MKSYIEGYLVVTLLLLASIYIATKSTDYGQTIEISKDHQSYINRLSFEDFSSQEKADEHLSYIKEIKALEIKFYSAINGKFIDIALIIFGCAAFQTAFLIKLHRSKKTYNQQLHRTP